MDLFTTSSEWAGASEQEKFLSSLVHLLHPDVPLPPEIQRVGLAVMTKILGSAVAESAASVVSIPKWLLPGVSQMIVDLLARVLAVCLGILYYSGLLTTICRMTRKLQMLYASHSDWGFAF